ncbi:hypothetical protein DV515_00011179 [Chloebia gouldiae]|uniref:Uncharacterized protein n=1 Tax=Chloebia gouldiae TaxID=44316 RepID=A0A3L8S6Z6_CHLGU|nr:hypothetical protein DV515_00011179 [Chloebia gouldiae]
MNADWTCIENKFKQIEQCKTRLLVDFMPLSRRYRQQLTLRDDGENPFSYSCGSIIHCQSQQAAAEELLNSLRCKTAAEDAPNIGKSTLPDQRAAWLHLNTLGSGAPQYRSCQQSQTWQWIRSRGGDEGRGSTRDNNTRMSIHRAGQLSSGSKKLVEPHIFSSFEKDLLTTGTRKNKDKQRADSKC